MHYIWSSISGAWNFLLYKPLYNILIAFVAFIPGHAVWAAVVVLTLVVKIIIHPLTKRSIESQLALKALEPEIKKIKEENKDQTVQAQKTFALYKENKVNPFSSCLTVFIQIPILFALYYAFIQGFSTIDTTLLYSFVHAPDKLNTMFLGMNLINTKNIILAIVAVLSQFAQTYIAMPQTQSPTAGTGPQSLQDTFAQTMQTQTKYVIPVIIGLVAYRLQGAVALYLITSNIVTVIQELVIRRNFHLRTKAK